MYHPNSVSIASDSVSSLVGVSGSSPHFRSFPLQSHCCKKYKSKMTTYGGAACPPGAATWKSEEEESSLRLVSRQILSGFSLHQNRIKTRHYVAIICYLPRFVLVFVLRVGKLQRLHFSSGLHGWHIRVGIIDAQLQLASFLRTFRVGGVGRGWGLVATLGPVETIVLTRALWLTTHKN